MPNPVVHFEIQAKDPKKVQEFYQKLFDWHIDDNNPMNYGMVDTHAEGGINGGIGESPEGVNRVTFYTQVNDLQAYLDKAEQLGGKTVMPPTEIPNVVTLAMFADPEGNIIGMVKEQ
jgi:predicted enzyme related to lactoylglutathione lyase